MPTIELEQEARSELKVQYVAGLDEAGRGAVAGPVVAAAVILPLDAPERLEPLYAVNDSKQLTFRQREALYDLIVEYALAYGVGSTPAHDIDRLGIIPANARAMQQALSQLQPAGEFLLIDGRMKLPTVPLPQRSVVRGDSLSLSIAAASILAKVSRDRHMIALSEQHPQYGFARHKGYCTRQHVAAIDEYGPCDVHRHSFAPIRRPLL
ncbi:MAG TPA: ribonuclease HII [Candidatus Sulfomarinibacteraceae bacterium]|nr:ribonuclease HII [Candidatus Sulfomarinibacteraceae bacterium]